MDDRRVGRLSREVRIHRGWRQRDLAERAGVSAAQISATERGRLEHVSLHALRKLGDALDIRVSIDPWWRAGRADQLLDRAHAALVDHIAGLLRDAGWEVLVEFTFNEYGDRGSVDILAWHAGTRTLLLVEVKSRIDDLQEAARSFMVKVRVVPKAVEREHGWQPATVSRVLAIIDTHANRALVGEHAATFDSIWAGRTAAVRRHIREPAAPLGGGIMFVPARACSADRGPRAAEAGRVIDLVRAGTARVLDLAFPGTCVGCGREGVPLCRTCAPALDARLDEPAGVPIGMPGDIPQPLVQVDWCAPFKGTVRAALHGIKYGGEQRLAEPLGAAIARRWTRIGAGGECLVHVPVHADRRRVRGYDQAERIAAAAARHLRLPHRGALERQRATIAQFDLDRRLRRTNVQGAFRVRRGMEREIRGRWIVLVDDVLTTGATLAACATALEEAGAMAVSAITVARER